MCFMKKKPFTVAQIAAILRQAELGTPVAEIIREVGISRATFFRWKKRYVTVQQDVARVPPRR